MKRLESNSLFEGLPEADIQRLESFIKIREFPKNSVLIDEGVPGSNMYLLIKGTVKITRIGLDGKETILTTRKPGDFFGEMALLDDAPRSARVIAVEDCEAGVIGKHEFNDMMIQEARVAVNILKVISMRLRQSNDQILQSMEEKEKYHAKQLERFQSLFEFGKAISSERDERALFHLLPVIIKSQVPCDDVLVYLDDVISGEIYASIKQGSAWKEWRFLPDDIAIKTLISLKKTFAIDDFSAYQYRDQLKPETFWKNAASVLVAPIVEQNAHRGMIVIQSVKPMKWDAEDQAFLSTLVSYAAIMLRNMRLTQQAMMDEKMSAVGKASSSLLHDFKNLLSVIHTLAQLIKKAKTPDEIPDLVGKITKSADLMIGMSQEVLMFGQGTMKLKTRPVDVREVVNLVMALVSGKEKSGLIEADIAPNLVCEWDPDKMARVLYNLMVNAVEAVEKGQAKVRIVAEKKGNTVEIAVSDNGQGIPEDVLPRIFAPFITTKKNGTGLGLPIVKNIVEAHKGKIDVRSKVGEGTTFTLTFPS